MNNRRVFDRVHGEVVLQRASGVLCSTEEFQRLDKIRQLGGCSEVYPSATHTRREHSIGVAYLAAQVGRHLQAMYPSLVHDDDVLCLEVAGLLHDLGHGPFSHLFEDYVHEHVDKDWTHEAMGLKLMRSLFSRPHIAAVLEEEFQRPVAVNEERIRMMILGHVGAPAFLFEVVHNQTNGIDVDKMDYLLRDNLAVFGASNPFNVRRLTAAIRVVDGHIYFDESVSFEVSQLWSLRAQMHRQVYQHRAVLVAEGLLKDLIAAHGRERIREGIEDEEKFLGLTDASMMEKRTHEVETVLARVLRRPWLRRLDVVVTLNVKPRCSECEAPWTGPESLYCTYCGGSGICTGVVCDGRFVSEECLWTADTIKTFFPETMVYVADVCLGSTVLKKDSRDPSKMWEMFSPWANFCNDDGTPILVEERASLYRERIVYFYVPLDATVDESLVPRIHRWGMIHGSSCQSVAS